MNPIPVFVLCAWCVDWSRIDIENIQLEAPKEFVPEITPVILGYNSSNGMNKDYCDIIIKVKSEIEKCSHLPKNITHESYCREWQGEDKDRPKYRIYIQKVNVCKEKWTADVSTPASGDVKVIGKLLQHCILTHLGLRSLDHTDPLDDNSNQHYSMCTDITVIPNSKTTASHLLKMDKRVREATECPAKARDNMTIPSHTLTKTFIILIILYILVQGFVCMFNDHVTRLRNSWA